MAQVYKKLSTNSYLCLIDGKKYTNISEIPDYASIDLPIVDAKDNTYFYILESSDYSKLPKNPTGLSGECGAIIDDPENNIVKGGSVALCRDTGDKYMYCRVSNSWETLV